MYSGTTFRNASGQIIGAHQKIDRVARRHLRQLLPQFAFPMITQILHFEGRNGPDGIKSKAPAVDEPWHFIDPNDPYDTTLLDMIEDHMVNLTEALKVNNEVRAAFEAAWLAHAITDGLTPAHHYPLEEKLASLREGEGLETRNNIRKKLFMPGANHRMKIKNNWEFWGAKGVMTTHVLFEFGVSTTIATRGLKSAKPTANDLITAQQMGIRAYFLQSLAHVNELKMYETFQKRGWTGTLAKQTANELIPIIIRTVTSAWYCATLDAGAREEHV